jgi:hypothetical protein
MHKIIQLQKQKSRDYFFGYLNWFIISFNNKLRKFVWKLTKLFNFYLFCLIYACGLEGLRSDIKINGSRLEIEGKILSSIQNLECT